MVLLGPSKSLSHGLLAMAHGTVIGVQLLSHGLLAMAHGTTIGVQVLPHGPVKDAHGHFEMPMVFPGPL
jgi:hypothetical protein